MTKIKTEIIILMFSIAALAAHAANGRIYTAADKLSSSMIACITQDHYGYIWIGTEYGLNKFDGYHFTNYFSDAKDTTTVSDNEISAFLTDRDNRLWIGCHKGLSRYDYGRNCFKRYRFPGKMAAPRIESIVQTFNGDIILSSAGYGLFAIKAGTDEIVRLHGFTRRSTDEFTGRIFEDDRHNIWRNNHLPVATRMKVNNLKPVLQKDFNLKYGPAVSCIKTGHRGFLLVCMYGVLRYDYATASFSDAGYDLSALDSRVSIRHACLDHAGNLYVGTSGRGVMMIPRGSRTLVQMENASLDFDLATANVNYVFEDKDNNLWISCYKKGLYQISRSQQAFSTWSFSSQHIRLGSSVSSMAEDPGGVWCTVQKAGVYYFSRDGRVFSKSASPDGANTIYRDSRGSFWLGTENALYSYNPADGASERKLTLSGWGVNCMADDGEGTLFVSNYGKGLVIYDTNTGNVRTISMYDKDTGSGKLCNDWIKSLYYDSCGILWIGCSDGLSCLNPDNGDFHVFGKGAFLPGYQCFSVCERRDGNMYIGTNAGLYVFDRKRNTPEPFPRSEEIQNKYIYSIVTDKSGDIWLSTASGIWQYDNRKGKFISHIRGNGLETTEYAIGTAVCEPDGRIIFGTNDGMVAFYPDNVRKGSIRMGDVYLTNFIVNGNPINCMTDDFEISYDDNSFVMEFSLLDFRDVDNVSFQYRINGGKWMFTQEGDNTISFNKLRPGTYNIEVRAHKNGAYSKVRVITVCVDDPWYSSTPAYFIYAFLLLCLSAALAKYYDRRRREELDEAKMRFLINATHDIRSPLTLILGPLKKLKSRITDGESHADIETIERNAQKLLVLVNQILDERKIDKNQMKLHCRETDLVEFIEGVCTLYRYNAIQRGITLSFEHGKGRVPVWIDRTHFDKVLANLLSNAFKYTYDGGTIAFRLECDEKNAVITLTDSGMGLTGEKTDRLFERFYQGRNSKDFHIEGTGIGLNLCKAIVTMHGGVIRAYNREDGVKGACFEVRIPLGCSHLKPEEIETDDIPADEGAARKKQASKNVRIMVVDDDPDIVRYIARELGNWYRFGVFPNGKDALKALLTDSYDLVISDVIMPEMDGITLLKKIKGNSNISDIPVILLTSKAEVSDRLEGLRRGADAYVAKPFNIEELHVLINNLICNVRRLRGKFSGAQEQTDKVEEIKVKGNNDKLMDRIMQSLNDNLSDPDYNVERLTADVGISRAQLHRKMKELTGISAGDFIRNMRLEQASKLIRDGKINVTQVAYAVGFSNQSHFSTIFRKHFGMSPSEYAAKMTEGEKE